MRGKRRIWLVTNDASGSNGEQATAALKRSCTEAGFAIERIIAFPEGPLPSAASLDDAGVDLVAVYAGDGTVNALVGALAGWQGALLVLPGGTMNLLCQRLHGDSDLDEIVRLAFAGVAKRARPRVLACGQGTALADLLAGPGTGWYEVREALREADVSGAAVSAANALGETLGAPEIVCRHPDLGRPDGYPLVMLTPTDGGIRVSGFYAETPAEFLKESWAVLRRRFREGPREELGVVEQVTLASTAGEPFGILLDGEKAESPGHADFRLVPCAVDLLATQRDGR
jgi:diacylglycerol kinase family enzyme